MNTIHVAASIEYDVLVGAGLLAETGNLVQSVTSPCRAAVISDSNVFPLYGETVARSLELSGFTVCSMTFPAGEESKNLSTYSDIVNFLAENHLSRSDVVIALGGGVTGDLTGFASATYLRGIKYVQIPTTLLACVDSSVGGKTAVDLPSGKNLAGAFYQPSLVICDPDTLSTLAPEVFRDGCAEVIKYGVLGNAEFFRELADVPASSQLEHVISVCVGMKRDIVEADEFDRGDRQKLNLGHSFGHAIEKCSSFGISHGSAVAIGMCIIARAAARKGYCSADTCDEIVSLVRRYGLPDETSFSADGIYKAALSDKKINGSTINLIVPRSIGKCTIEKIPSEDIPDWLECGGVI